MFRRRSTAEKEEAAQPTPTERSRSTAPRPQDLSRDFPGGRPKLPTLDPASSGPQVEFVDRAFREPEPETDDDGGGVSTGRFTDYFPSESLFEKPDTSIADRINSAPYRVLGIPTSSSWDAIVAAHRTLAKKHHPDRMLGASPAQIADATDQLLAISEAYSELERRRRR